MLSGQVENHSSNHFLVESKKRRAVLFLKENLR